MAVVAFIAGCTTTPSAPTKYTDRQTKELPLGFFSYSEEPGSHYLEYQGTSGNTLDELERFLRQRATELCAGNPQPFEVGHGVWTGRDITWGMSIFTVVGPRPGIVPLPTPTEHSATFPKVSARIQCL